MPRSLATYRAKRDFALTQEPSDSAPTPTGDIFMVQKHAATRLHWDFRLELDGVLLSWAVTRGPSDDPEDKRLAVRTEDHPIAYATFEGTIPKGQYGGGTVMLWDRGTWTPLHDPKKGLKDGKLHFVLHGERMKGEWVIFRLKAEGKRENWLLRKVEDEWAGKLDLVGAHVTSVATGRGMEAIAGGGGAVWNSDESRGKAGRVTSPLAGEAATRASSRGAERGRTTSSGYGAPTPLPARQEASPRLSRKGRGKVPAFRPPMLATLVDTPPTGNGWLHETKYDGYRALIAVAGGAAAAFTRSGLDWSEKFAAVVAACATLKVKSALIDGEIVALDAEGAPSFSALQTNLKTGGPLLYFAFDLLELNGKDMAAQPLETRKAALAELLADAPPPLHYAEHVRGGGEAMFAALCGAGYEGVVSKKAGSRYSGGRSPNWLKSKCTKRQEFVIGGWSESDKGRGFASLLLGVHEADGSLRYAGRVGTGFDDRTLADLTERFAKLAVAESPFSPKLTGPERRGAHFVMPRLVAEIAFTEWTADRHLRHPSFLGLRGDKAADEVVEEVALSLPLEGRARDARPSRAARGGGLSSTNSLGNPHPARLPLSRPPLKGEGQDEFFGVTISSPDREVFPELGLTKSALAAYYAAVAPHMLELMRDRPVSLVRCPQGRGKQCFFQKHDSGMFGGKLPSIDVTESNGDVEPYLYVHDEAGLLTAVQMGTIEFHGWGSTVADLERPDRLVIDLDPDEGLSWAAIQAAALVVKDRLSEAGLESSPLLSGGKGVHIVAPLKPRAEWPEVKAWARAFAEGLEAELPTAFVANMSKAKRKGRIFVDWLRNQRGATAVMPYSVRARDGAPVAVPVSWAQLAAAASPAMFGAADPAAVLAQAASGVPKVKARVLPSLS